MVVRVKRFRVYEEGFYIPGHSEAIREIREYSFADDSLASPESYEELIRVQLWYDLLVGREQQPWMVKKAKLAVGPSISHEGG